MLPGMTATVTLAYRRASILGDRIQIPVSAVMKTPDEQQVAWLLSAEGTVSPRPVTLGAVSGCTGRSRRGTRCG